jgi:hypothetical protein
VLNLIRQASHSMPALKWFEIHDAGVSDIWGITLAEAMEYIVSVPGEIASAH